MEKVVIDGVTYMRDTETGETFELRPKTPRRSNTSEGGGAATFGAGQGLMVSNDLEKVISYDKTGNVQVKGALEVTQQIKDKFSDTVSMEYDTRRLEAELRQLELTKRKEDILKADQLKDEIKKQKEAERLQMIEDQRRQEEMKEKIMRDQSINHLNDQYIQVCAEYESRQIEYNNKVMQLERERSKRNSAKCWKWALCCVLPPISWIFCRNCCVDKISKYDYSINSLKPMVIQAAAYLESSKVKKTLMEQQLNNLKAKVDPPPPYTKV